MKKLGRVVTCAISIAIIAYSCNTIQYANEMFSKKETDRAGISRCAPPRWHSTNEKNSERGDYVTSDARSAAVNLFLQDRRWAKLPNLSEETKCFKCDKFLWETYPYCTCISLSAEDSNSKVYCGCTNYPNSCAVALQQKVSTNVILLPIFLFIKPEYMKAVSNRFPEYLSTLYFFLKKRDYTHLKRLQNIVSVEYIKRMESQNGKGFTKEEYEALMGRSLLVLINEYNNLRKEKSLNYSLTSNNSSFSNGSRRGLEVSQKSTRRQKIFQSPSYPPSSFPKVCDVSENLMKGNRHTEEIFSYGSTSKDYSYREEKCVEPERSYPTLTPFQMPSVEERERKTAEGRDSGTECNLRIKPEAQENFLHIPPDKKEVSQPEFKTYELQKPSSIVNLGHARPKMEERHPIVERELEPQQRWSFRSSSSEGGILNAFMKNIGEQQSSLKPETPYTTISSEGARLTFSKGEGYNNHPLDSHNDKLENISTIEKRPYHRDSINSSIRDPLGESFDGLLSKEEDGQLQPLEIEVFQKMFGKREMSEFFKTQEGRNLIGEYQYKNNRIKIETANAMNELLLKKNGFLQTQSFENGRPGKIVKNRGRV